MAGRLAAAGTATGARVALDARGMLDAAARQAAVEHGATSLLDVTGPAEAATAMAFRHTAVVAGRPDNTEPLAEAGRLFGRLAHLLDAVEDLHADRATGAWNPIDALQLTPDEVRRHCDDAVLGSSGTSEQRAPLWTWLIVMAVMAFFLEGLLLKR